MKKLLLFAVLVFFASSCTNFDSTTQPVNPTKKAQLIKLPAHTKSAIENTFTRSKEVNGVVGDTINFHFSYTSDQGTPVNIYGVLTIPAGAFNYTTTIRLELSDQDAVIDCYPTPTTFDKPLKLDLTHEGLNLDNVGNGADFYYIKSDNSVESLNKVDKIILHSNGTLEVKGAELPHFTRFGWSV